MASYTLTKAFSVHIRNTYHKITILCPHFSFLIVFYANLCLFIYINLPLTNALRCPSTLLYFAFDLGFFLEINRMHRHRLPLAFALTIDNHEGLWLVVILLSTVFYSSNTFCCMQCFIS